MDIDFEKLLVQLNYLFDTKLLMTDINVNSNISHFEFFNQYLSLMDKSEHIYNKNTIVFLKDKSTLDINCYYIENNNIQYNIISKTSKKKFRDKLLQYKIIITNFPIEYINGKRFYRYEIIKNYFSGYDCHYFGKNYKYSKNEVNPLFSNSFQRYIYKHPLIEHASLLLNYFEMGNFYGDILFKPKITVSQYGRWYYSGSYKIQNSLKERDFFINNIKDQGHSLLSIDLKSAEGREFYFQNPSKNIKILLNNRFIDSEISEISKFLLNVLIHSEQNESIIRYIILKKYSLKKINQYYHDFDEFLKETLREISLNNEEILKRYRKNISIKENFRRMVNPLTILNECDNMNIVEHRKYLQGHVHDKMMIISKFLFDKMRILPVYLIHDEISYLCNDDIINNIQSFMKKFNIKATINIY